MVFTDVGAILNVCVASTTSLCTMLWFVSKEVTRILDNFHISLVDVVSSGNIVTAHPYADQLHIEVQNHTSICCALMWEPS